MSDGGLHAVIAAWELASSLQRLRPGAADERFEAAEHELGRPLPQSFRRLYTYADGGDLLGGNLQLHPLVPDRPGELSVATASRLMREWKWAVPDELVIFGGDGAGDAFGFWLPARRSAADAPVVQLSDSGDMAVVGTSLVGFLRGWTAYYLAVEAGAHDVADALASLRVPDELARLDESGSDEEFFAFMCWGDPKLPDPRPDPNESGYDADDLRMLLS